MSDQSLNNNENTHNNDRMMIIMTYHSLTDRDPRYIHGFWGCSVFICMAIIVLVGIFSMHGAQKLFEAFDNSCIYTGNITFIPRNDNTSTTSDVYIEPKILLTTQIVMTRMSTPLPNAETKSKSYQRKINHIFRDLHNEEINHDQGDLNGFEEDRQLRTIFISPKTLKEVKTHADLVFLQQMQVDIIKTKWAPLVTCEYALYNQVLSTIAGMICTTMLVLYNRTGKSQMDWGIPRPWRIVFPAAVTFGIMTIVCIIYLCIMTAGYKEFCTGLAKHLKSKELECSHLINAFYPVPITSLFEPGTHYKIHMFTSKVNLVAWLVAFLIMIARMLFVIDFRLVRVTISTYPMSEIKKKPIESSSSETTSGEETEQKVERLTDTASKLQRIDRSGASSREDIEDYQSAQSEPDGTTVQPSSLEPLIVTTSDQQPTTSKMAEQNRTS